MKVDKVNDHIPGYIKNEKKTNSPEDNTPIDPAVNNNITTTLNTSNITNNAYTVNIQYRDLYEVKYHHHPRHHKYEQPNDFRQLIKDITNLRFDCYHRDFLINFLNLIF